jgi:hypothetical protein
MITALSFDNSKPKKAMLISWEVRSQMSREWFDALILG